MSDESDSWFKPFGFDPAKFAADTLNTVEKEVATAVQDVKTVVQKVDAVVSSGITTVVKKVANAVTPSGGPSAGGSGNGGSSSISSLGGSVGQGGQNNPADVKAVQAALNSLAGAGLAVDGKCGGGTVNAIIAFQKGLGQSRPDGRIDPGGATARALAGGGGGGSAAAPAQQGEDPGNLLDQLAQGAKDLGGKVIKEVEDDANAALGVVKTLGGEVIEDAKNALGDPGIALASVDAQFGQDLADRIIQVMKSGGDLTFILTRFRSMSMEEVLDVMTRLKNAGKLEDFRNRLPSGNPRIAVAILTVKPEFSSEWQKLVSALNDADRKAILARTPKDVRIEKGFGPGPADPQDPDKDDDDGNEEVVVQNFIAVQAKLEFKAKGTNLGKTEFTVKLSPDGKLSGVEVDMTLIQQKLKKMGALAPILDLEASLSLNAEAGFDQQDAKLVFDGVQAAVKGEVQLRFKTIPILKAVRFKLSATVGPGGAGIGGTIEIPIPGT